MKDSVYFSEKSREYDSYVTNRKPMVVVLIVAVVIVLTLNLINAIVIN